MASKVRIAARLRSSSGGRDSKDGKDRDASYIAVTNPRDPSQVFKFPFSSCYDEHSTQEEIFRNDTVTIFAHTMQGTRSDPAMFERREEMTQRADLAVSYGDLQGCRDNLPVRENDAGMVFVANLSSEFNTIYNQATRNRSVGSTNLNRASSRSHAYVFLYLNSVAYLTPSALTGKINLVDLAGNDATRMQESAAINKSLSVLGQVVHALNQGAPRIPYRNSRLTRILQDAWWQLGCPLCVKTKNIENKPVNERDNPSMLQAIAGPSTAASLEIVNNPSMGAGPMRRAARPSLAPGSRVPRGQSFALPGGGGRRLTAVHERGSMPPVQEAPAPAFFVKDLDERISKAVEAAVEAEVARRLAEKEKEWQEEQRRLEAVIHEKSEELQGDGVGRLSAGTRQENRDVSQQAQGTSLPAETSGFDEQLQERLEELERKFEKGNKETQLADVLSPVSKKKTGRAYVALARAHSEKGDLEVALDLYRKAESYVPDNIKLKERIIEIEWAVKNNTAFVPSPKKPRKQKESKKPKSKLGQEAFGVEVTNTAATSSNENLKELVATKRTYEDSEDPLANKVLFPGTASPITQTPMKRQRRDAVGLVDADPSCYESVSE
ncbi:kinesin-domain-containing protein [Coprinopsis sp. MPI-PUGE-AT-0042]|nr:kinesin-domain-containing protein [Coprinopsis sp. MPI-PUGE-AT-0042]